MRKVTGFFVTMMFLVAFIPMQLKADASSDLTLPDSTQTVQQSTEIALLSIRLNEINEIDKSALSGSERRALRREVRTINKTMAELDGGGVYISVGAAILIVLLLILLL